MRRTLVSITALLVSVFVLMLGNGLLGTFLSVRMTLENFSVELVGAAMSGYFIGLVTGAVSAGGIVRRAGHIRAFAAFGALTTASIVAHGLWIAPLTWIGLRMVTGYSVAGLYLVIESWLNDRATSANRGRIFSIYMITSFGGLGLGQFLLNVRDPAGDDLFMLAAALLSLALIPVAITSAPSPAPPGEERLATYDILRRSLLGVAGSAGAGLITGAHYALGPVYALEAGLGTAGVAAFMGAAILGGLALQWPVGHLSDRFDRRRVFAGLSLALLAVSAALAAWASPPYGVLLALATVFGGLSFTLYPIAVAHANDLIDQRHFVPASAVLLFTFGVGAALGPMLAGLVMSRIGHGGLFVFIGVTAAVLAVVSHLRHSETVPAAEQTPFVAMVRTSPAIAGLDPRAADEHAGPDAGDAAPDAGAAGESPR